MSLPLTYIQEKTSLTCTSVATILIKARILSPLDYDNDLLTLLFISTLAFPYTYCQQSRLGNLVKSKSGHVIILLKTFKWLLISPRNKGEVFKMTTSFCMCHPTRTHTQTHTPSPLAHFTPLTLGLLVVLWIDWAYSCLRILALATPSV